MTNDVIAAEEPVLATKEGVALPASRVRYQVLGFVCFLAVVTYIQPLGFSNRARFRSGSHLDVEPPGRSGHPLSVLPTVSLERGLAHLLRADGQPGSALVRSVLALVPQPPGRDAPGQSRRTGSDRRRPAGAPG